MKILEAEKFVTGINEVYPITIIKFLLNRQRILNYFKKVHSNNIQDSDKFTVDNSHCPACSNKSSQGQITCRPHSTIHRVLTATHVSLDVDSKCYFHKNEIFKFVDGKLVIFYCPHTKLIRGELTDSKVRKINYMLVEGVSTIPNYEIKEFTTLPLLEQNMRCWFNETFSIVTTPSRSRDFSNFFLLLNKKREKNRENSKFVKVPNFLRRGRNYD